jgi:hypothetical protein
MAVLPPLPSTEGYGSDWMDRLSGGRYVVPAWGSDGWDADDWPLVILVHYDGDDEVPYAWPSIRRATLTVKEFKTRQERDQATNEMSGLSGGGISARWKVLQSS